MNNLVHFNAYFRVDHVSTCSLWEPVGIFDGEQKPYWRNLCDQGFKETRLGESRNTCVRILVD